MEGKITYDVREVARLLNVSTACVYQLCQREDFPAIRVSPRRIVIPAQGLQEWLNKGKAVSL